MARTIIGLDETIAVLREVDKRIIADTRKEIRKTVTPLAKQVQSSIPVDAPVSGMWHNGRTGWLSRRVRVTVKTNFGKRATAQGRISIVAVWVGGKANDRGGAGFMIADLAGYRGKVRTSGRSKPYPKRPSGHALSGQGRSLIRGLNRDGHASRYVWKNAQHWLPTVEQATAKILDKLAKEANSKLAKRIP